MHCEVYYSFFQNAYTQFLKLWLHFSKLYTQNHKTHTQHTKRHTHLAKANTSLKTLNSFKYFFLHSNSTHKHKIISHIHAKLHTDVKNVKHYSRVYFACSECSEEQEFVRALAHNVHAYAHIQCIYSMYD